MFQLMLCLIVLVFAAVINVQGQQVEIQKEIAEEIIRFHILANSDSKEDQNLKLKVKEEIVRYLQSQLMEADCIEQAREIICLEEQNIERIARAVIVSEGYHYDVTASLERCDFPIKRYGDLTFPAGEYEALRILIGQSEGKNWWCVMFPSLCFINETYSVVPEESKNQLKYLLSEEEFNALLQPELTIDELQVESTGEMEEGQIQIRFKMLEWLKSVW